MNPGREGRTRTLVLNGAECEPFITCDDMLMRERAAGIVKGTAILRHLLQADEVLIGIEDNKPEAAAAMRAAVDALNEPFSVIQVPTLYPAGGAKQLIRVLTGKEVPAVAIGIGEFLNTVIQFVIVAFAIFLLVKAVNRLHRKPDAAPATAPAAAPAAPAAGGTAS